MGENPMALLEGANWAIHHRLIPIGAQPYIQSFPVSAVTVTTQLFFGRSHKNSPSTTRAAPQGGVKHWFA